MTTPQNETGEKYREEFEKETGIKPHIPDGTLYIPYLESRLSALEKERKQAEQEIQAAITWLSKVKSEVTLRRLYSALASLTAQTKEEG